MKWIAISGALMLATPALAHHEVVVAASMVPLMGGIAAIAAAGVVAKPRGVLWLWSKLRLAFTGSKAID